MTPGWTLLDAGAHLTQRSGVNLCAWAELARAFPDALNPTYHQRD